MLMKRILLLIGILFFSGIVAAQEALHIAPIFSGKYNRDDRAVVVILKGKKLEPYHLSLFHSITLKQSPEDVLLFEKAVLADGENAVNSEMVKSGTQVMACYYQLPPLDKDKPDRFILFRKVNKDSATLIYLEGKTSLENLIKIFINKKKS